MSVELLLIVFIKVICNICVHWWVKRHQTYQQLVRHFLIHELTLVNWRLTGHRRRVKFKPVLPVNWQWCNPFLLNLR